MRDVETILEHHRQAQRQFLVAFDAANARFNAAVEVATSVIKGTQDRRPEAEAARAFVRQAMHEAAGMIPGTDLFIAKQNLKQSKHDVRKLAFRGAIPHEKETT